MPHAVNNDTMGEPAVNGEKVHSQFINHLTSYPVVSDSIATIKSNKYAAKSLDLADQSYNRFAKPVLPYFTKPYEYVAPYVSKADAFGDKSLDKVDETFPIIKEDTEKIRGTILDNAYFPLKFAGDVKQHVFDTYGSEYKKCGGDGLIASGKAIITTSLLLSQESLGWLSALLSAKKEQPKEAANDKLSN